MPKGRPALTGYSRIAQDEADEDSDGEAPVQGSRSYHGVSSTHYEAIQPRGQAMRVPRRQSSEIDYARHVRRGRRTRSNSSGVDIKAINARLERWAEEFASKFKIKRRDKNKEEKQLEIHYSVFQAPEGVRPIGTEDLANFDYSGWTKREDFDKLVDGVRLAITKGVHPTMISQGSSGSYFARDEEGRIVGVFKPKDEEPYASRNPKWTKWLHRNLFPCFFGRACLIPNLSYVSEAAAYVLDRQLRTHLVPYTDIVRLSSKAFHYDYWERRNFYRFRKALPEKIGSFQIFLKGFRDANVFLREHPWPDQQAAYRSDPARKKRKKVSWMDNCRPGTGMSDDEEDLEAQLSDLENADARFVWSENLQVSFREELEKLVILDYIMRNTDRGLDNWMIRIDQKTEQVTIVTEPPSFKIGEDDEEEEGEPAPRVVNGNGNHRSSADAYRRLAPMAATSRSTSPAAPSASITIGAIDNSLSWPWKHPDAWRSFPFGWLFLPVSLIGQPFSQKTRDHFLPLLTSPKWWMETQTKLRAVFEQDSDFQERMFAKQIAVMKGQAWNVVETLKIVDHGPLELTRRARVCVWDDLVNIPVAANLRGHNAVEMRQRATNNPDDLADGGEEEMDITATVASLPPRPEDLVDFESPSQSLLMTRSMELPNPNRFDISRPIDAVVREEPSETTPLSPSSPPASRFGEQSSEAGTKKEEPNKSKTSNITSPPLASPPLPRSRLSYDGAISSRSLNNHHHHKSNRRRLSLSLGGSGHTTPRRTISGGGYGDDDLEGDLGYAAAEDMEGNQRKVIVERLETVKGTQPVFSWC